MTEQSFYEFPQVTSDLARNVKKAREKAGMTQQELADFAGVHVLTVSNIERNEKASPSLEVVWRIGIALSKSVTWLTTPH